VKTSAYNTPPIMTADAVARAMERYDDACRVGRRLRWARRQNLVSHQSTVSLVERGCRRLTGRERLVAVRVLGIGIGWLDGRRPKVIKGVTPVAQVAA
jgi:hypothetical protein